MQWTNSMQQNEYNSIFHSLYATASTVFIYKFPWIPDLFFEATLMKISLKYWNSSFRLNYLFFTLRKRSANFEVCEQRFCEILLGYYMW